MRKSIINIIKHDPLVTPEMPLVKSTRRSAAWDIFPVTGAVSEDCPITSPSWTIKPGESMLVPTGLRFEMPPCYYAGIYSRSGLSLKGIIVANAPGIIDPDYEGEVKVILANISQKKIVIVSRIAIAQVMFHKVGSIQVDGFCTVRHMKRGQGGFGSTNKKP